MTGMAWPSVHRRSVLLETLYFYLFLFFCSYIADISSQIAIPPPTSPSLFFFRHSPCYLHFTSLRIFPNTVLPHWQELTNFFLSTSVSCALLLSLFSEHQFIRFSNRFRTRRDAQLPCFDSERENGATMEAFSDKFVYFCGHSV